MVIQVPGVQSIALSARYLRMKRVLDIAFVLLTLPLILALGTLIAVCIKIDSKGPVFFRQKRVGKDGVEFEMFKFRSMYNNVSDLTHREIIKRYMKGERLNENSAVTLSHKQVNDPRVTRVGRFIRKTSLDELPQFWNVLRGDMTLVGPRPPLPYEVERYSAYDWLRLAGNPGVTGKWQVYGRSRVTFQEMVEMDIEYLQTSSIWIDVKLILLTIPVVVLGSGGA